MADRPSAAGRARRLLGLLSHLRAGASIPLSDLATALGATPEEVAADLQTLSMCGVHPYDPLALVDVFVEEDGNVHAYAEPPALTRPVRLTPPESRALVAALRSCGFSAADDLVLKLETASAPVTEREDVERLVRAHAAAADEAVYATLARAVEEGAEIEAVYLAAGAAAASERTIRPYGLGWREGAWYLSAYCTSAMADRTFRIDRFLSVRRTGTLFERPSAPPSAAPDFTVGELPRATLRFASSEHPSARDWPGAVLERVDDGSTLALVPYSSPRWLARQVASRLGGVTVLEPEEVREAVLAIAKEGTTGASS